MSVQPKSSKRAGLLCHLNHKNEIEKCIAIKNSSLINIMVDCSNGKRNFFLNILPQELY